MGFWIDFFLSLSFRESVQVAVEYFFMGKQWDLHVTLESNPNFVVVCYLSADLKNILFS